MDILLVILAISCGLIGLLGAFLPVLPGTPLSLVGLFLMHWSDYADYSPTVLWTFTIITLGIILMDYLAPAWMTKKFGGSDFAAKGSLAGMIIGIFFFPPFGMIIGPFIGAFIGEMIANKDAAHAFKVACVSFFTFLLGTGIKFIVSGIMLFYILHSLF
ncbi:MAG: DUF456 domain-containing protein [Bacteroidales bacterium]